MINLFTAWYQCHDEERQKELDFCRETNENHPLIDNYIFWEDRFTYYDFFEACKDYPDHINILANGDIYFNDTLSYVTGISARECYALTRWEEEGNSIVPFESKHKYNKYAKARHSQDVWIFRGVPNRIYGAFHLGIPGCDNRIAYEIMRAGYLLTNPSLTIQAIHKHKEEARNYNIPEGVPKQVPKPWKWVEQSKLITRRAV